MIDASSIKSSLGDDCDRPACEDTVSALNAAMDRLKKKNKNKKSGGTSENNCPPTRDAIGRSSWTLLHSMAAWYPDRPSSLEREKMTQLMEAISIFYPCSHCAIDFQQSLKDNPVRTKTRTELCRWLCEQHNAVNEKLGKPTFSCTMTNLDRRWRKNPSCSGDAV